MSDDKPSQELAKQVAEEVTPAVSRFIGTVAGSPGIEASELIAERIRAWRFNREIRYVTKAMEQLGDAGLDPKAVPLRTLAPLLEGGSLEDDESLSDKWAALLANAAGGEADVPASFPYVLRELEPAAAQILDAVYDTMMSVAPALRGRYGLDQKRADLRTRCGVSEEDFRFQVDNLLRLRLVRGPVLEPDEHSILSLTEFGRAFVRACRPPGQPDPPVRIHDKEQLDKLIEEARQQEAQQAFDAPAE